MSAAVAAELSAAVWRSIGRASNGDSSSALGSRVVVSYDEECDGVPTGKVSLPLDALSMQGKQTKPTCFLLGARCSNTSALSPYAGAKAFQISTRWCFLQTQISRLGFRLKPGQIQSLKRSTNY